MVGSGDENAEWGMLKMFENEGDFKFVSCLRSHVGHIKGRFAIWRFLSLVICLEILICRGSLP
jgi:hypothetical protein